MNWSDIAKKLAGLGLPLLGGAAAGPAGVVVGKLIASGLGLADASPEAIDAAVMDPANLLALRRLESEERTTLLKLTIDAETAQVQAVNATMQAESKSEHWAQWFWRPFIGFCFGVQVFGTYFVLPLAKVPVPAVPESVWVAYLAVLGVASYFRGKQKLGDA